MKRSLVSLVAKGLAMGAVAILEAGTVGIAWGGTDVGNGMPVGITRGQTARLNVLNSATPGITCPVQLMFFDSMGNELARGMFEVMPGHLMFLDLNGDDVLLRRAEQRLQIYGLGATDQANRRACGNLVATLEVFDNTTFKTMVILTPPNLLFAPGK